LKHNVVSKHLNKVFSEVCRAIPFLRNLPVPFVDEGFTFYAYIQDFWRFTKPFEPLTYAFLLDHVDENDVFLDVGAHIGLYAIRLASKVSKVVALEPEPNNYNFLCRNVLANNLSEKVIALPIAASDENGYADLCVKSSSGAHTLEDSKNCKEKKRITTLKVDTLLRILRIKSVDLVKIDVEGHESRVISGMSKTLSLDPPRVLVIENQKTNLSLREFLAKLGYKVVVLDCWDSTCNYGFYMVK